MLPIIHVAIANGWQVDRARNNHIRFRSKDGFVVFAPSTPSDYRSILNVKSKLRKAGLKI